jgi:hypothetical protein
MTKENALEMANRELIPKLRELASMQRDTEVTGSRGGATVAVLTQVLTVLASAGIITDSTTP